MCELAFYLLDPAVIISGEALKQVILGPARAGEGRPFTIRFQTLWPLYIRYLYIS